MHSLSIKNKLVQRKSSKSTKILIPTRHLHICTQPTNPAAATPKTNVYSVTHTYSIHSLNVCAAPVKYSQVSWTFCLVQFNTTPCEWIHIYIQVIYRFNRIFIKALNYMHQRSFLDYSLAPYARNFAMNIWIYSPCQPIGEVTFKTKPYISFKSAICECCQINGTANA